MPELKTYQRLALETLSEYFRECTRTNDADTAFYTLTKEKFGRGIPYHTIRGMEGMPYVCVRVPTGGGKTVLACHAIGLATRELLHATRSFVLWLVPSNAIRAQTMAALKDKKHFYRQALESTLGAITVLNVGEALYLSRPTLDTETVIIVATLQAFRVEETDGRKVYESNGALMNHFVGWPAEATQHLEKLENGEFVYSLANILRLRSPIVIVDEAHNARTDLSFETLARFRPACILEFTATPDTEHSPSNVIHTASAAELKAEEMIKLPVQFQRRDNWQELLTDAIAARDQLEQVARLEQQQTGEYLRPIMLIQAQARRGPAPITVETVRATLINDHRIPAEQIKEATGEQNELYDIPNLKDPQCPVRFIITVQALREGWDCPFAYVLCTIAELRASTAVEQILGRVLRMPNAQRKQHPELNRAYAFATSASFEETAKALKDALVESGFNRQEVNDLIVVAPQPSDTPPMLTLLQPSVTTTLTTAPDFTYLPSATAGKVLFDREAKTLTFMGAMTEADHLALAGQMYTPSDQAALETMYRQARGFALGVTPQTLGSMRRTPAERGEKFSVPLLAIKQGEWFEPFEDTHFREDLWDLAAADAALNEAEFASERPAGQAGLVDVNEQGRVVINFLEDLRARQMALALDYWTVGRLLYWLEYHIPHKDLETADVSRFLQRMIRSLMDQRGLKLEFLVHNKIQLRAAAEKKVDDYRQTAQHNAFNSLLLPAAATPLVVTPEICFAFDPNAYPYNTLYRGAYEFKKHYYPQVGNLKDIGEEYECAEILDKLPEVEFWVRNIERHPQHSFWIQTRTDRFYPDFVCKLKDGRIAVVEYKNFKDWSNDDNQEKRDLGELWEARSNGSCLFIMPKGKDFESIRQKVQIAKS
jgi:type III restriction enzyme